MGLDMFNGIYSLFLPQIIFQILCVLHIVKYGRDRYWIYLVLFLPYVGCIVYFFAEILPSLRTGGILKNANDQVGNALFPARKIKALEEQIALADTYQNRLILAEAYAAAERYDDSLQLFEKILTGIYKEDAVALGKRAMVYYSMKNNPLALKDFEQIISRGTKLEEKEQLVYAIVLEELNQFEKAAAAYHRAVGIATGLEAEYRFALLLQKIGKEEDAVFIFQDMIRKTRSSPSYFKRRNSKWVNLAKEELQKVPA